MQQLVTQFDTMQTRSVVATPSCCGSSSSCCCCCIITLVAAPIVSAISLRGSYKKNFPDTVTQPALGAYPPASEQATQPISPYPTAPNAVQTGVNTLPNSPKPRLLFIILKNFGFYIGLLAACIGASFVFPYTALAFSVFWAVILYFLYKETGKQSIVKPVIAAILFPIAFAAELYAWITIFFGG